MKRWIAAVALLSFLAAPLPAAPPDEDEAAARREEAALPALPPAPPRLGASTEDEVWFVRLRSARIGGNFDSAGAEEVHVFAALGGSEQVLARQGIDLGDDLADHAFEGAPWLELPGGRPLALELTVKDEDLTEWETIAPAAEPLRVTAAAFGDGGRATVRLPLEEIRGSKWSLFGGTKTFEIEGGFLDLELARAPRRDARDGEVRAAVRAAFGPFLSSSRPRTAAEAARLEAPLRDRAIEAMHTARTSLHTRLRADLAALAAEAYVLARLARTVSRGAVDSEPLRARLRRLDAAAARLDAKAAEVVASCRALGQRELPDELGDPALDLLEALAAEAKALQRRLPRDLAATEEGRRLREHLAALSSELEAVLQGYAARPQLARAWEAFVGRVEVAAGEE